MKERKPLSLRAALWLATTLLMASMVLGASALYGYQLYRASRQQDRLRVQTLAEAYAAQIAPLMLSNRATDFQTFLDQMAWHPSVVLTAVLSTEQDIIASRGNAPLLDRYLRLPGAGLVLNEPRTWNVPGDAAKMMPELNLSAVAIIPSGATAPVGQLVCAARAPNELATPVAEVWSFFALLMLIALAGLIAGVCWLKQHIVAPLERITKASAGRGLRGLEQQLADRQDEIGEVARLVGTLHEDLRDSQEHHARLQKTVSSRVAAETQKITRELANTKKMAWSDPLTGLGNRAMFEEQFEKVFAAQAAADMDLSVVMIDVDNFKKLNDTLGHKAGDDLLEFIGKLLKQCLREGDMAVRYGGDEFILILPSVQAEDAERVAQRTIAMFGQQAKLIEVENKPSLSAGVASLHKNRASTADLLWRMADEALYVSKRSGKAQVKVHEGHTAALGKR